MNNRDINGIRTAMNCQSQGHRVSEAEAAQLRGTVCLNLGALAPPEIAMRIVTAMSI